MRQSFYRPIKVYHSNFCSNSNHWQIVKGVKMRLVLFILGALLLGGLYLYFLETWRIGCAVLWALIPAYICAGVAIIEK